MMKQTKNYTKALLLCGILSSLLYIGTDILASLLYEGYSYTSQQVSELSAIGAPTRQLWIAMSYIWAPLVIAFGIGILLLAGPKRSLRITGALLIMYAVIGLLWDLAPMHQRGTVELAGDIMHIVFASVQVLLIILFIILGSGADGTGFRIYSIATIIALLGFGAWTGTQVSRIAEGLSTPWMGIIERVNVYSSMLWVLVFAVILLRAEKRSDIYQNITI
jgi:hypothetical protein